jgi:beta-glucosidase
MRRRRDALGHLHEGRAAGDEVVQVYLRDLFSSVTRPVKELKAFRRVSLQPGAATTVSFTLGPDQLGMWDRDMKWNVEPGEFSVMVGSNSVDLKSTTLTVTE